MSDYFAGFTAADSFNQDVITIKRAYIDLLGNLTEAAVFTQIMYWHGSDKEGRCRLRVQKNKEWWIAKSYDEWAEECHITARAARDAITRITKTGLIIRKNFFFDGKKTVHIRVDKQVFENQMSKVFDMKRQILGSIRHDTSDTSDTIRQIHPIVSDIKRQTITDTTSTDTTKQIKKKEAPKGAAPAEKNSSEHRHCTDLIKAWWDITPAINRPRVDPAKMYSFKGYIATAKWAVGEGLTPEKLTYYLRDLVARHFKDDQIWYLKTVCAQAVPWCKVHYRPPTRFVDPQQAADTIYETPGPEVLPPELQEAFNKLMKAWAAA